MKKKGLLISTIVMVVVLVASLTTATYAWFSAEASVQIQQMALKTSATDGLIIGARTGLNEYSHGQLTWTAGNEYWTKQGDDYVGLGSDVLFDSAGTGVFGFDVTKACTPFAPSGQSILEAAGIHDQTSGTAPFISAEAKNGNEKLPETGSSGASGSVMIAQKNISYIDLELGVSASSEGAVKQAYCTVYITPQLGTVRATLGMAAALHVIVYVDDTIIIGTEDFGKDIYGTFEYNSELTTTNGLGDSAFGIMDANGNLAFAFDIFKAASDASGTDRFLGADKQTPAKRVRIIAWYEGYDESCINANTGSSANMEIALDYIGKNKDTFTMNADFTYAGLTAQKNA